MPVTLGNCRLGPKHPKERYQARVDLEFEASAEKAKEFHDALLLPAPIVQAGADVKWSHTKT